MNFPRSDDFQILTLCKHPVYEDLGILCGLLVKKSWTTLNTFYTLIFMMIKQIYVYGFNIQNYLSLERTFCLALPHTIRLPWTNNFEYWILLDIVFVQYCSRNSIFTQKSLSPGIVFKKWQVSRASNTPVFKN